MSGETKETTATTTTLEDGNGGGGGLVVKSTPSLASRLNQRADLLRRIFSFHKTKNPKHYINLRSSSKLFHRALHQPPPLWTSYPNSNHPTLQSLVNRLEELRGDEESSGNVPSVLFIEEGECRGGGERDRDRYVKLKKPLSIIGAGCGKTTLIGVGLMIQGSKSEGIVEIEDLTIKGAKEDGLSAFLGMKVIMSGCTVEECKGRGVYAYYADISCDDLLVVGCGESGVCVDYATITLSGQGTSIQGNNPNGESHNVFIPYGLKASSSSSKIHIVHPLTKNQISKHNGGAGNWGGDGTIEQVSKSTFKKPRTKTIKNNFFIGQKCCCRWKSMTGKYYNCEILGRNKDGTYVVDYEDGDKDSSVEWQRLHKDPI